MCSIQQPILPCPLCCQPNFSSVDSLRTSLVSVTNRPLMCPICNDILLGLDKLTIHLFSHTMHQQPLPQPSLEPRNTPSTPSVPSIASTMYFKVESDISDPILQMDQSSNDTKSIDSLKMVRRRRSKPSTNQNVIQTEPSCPTTTASTTAITSPSISTTISTTTPASQAFPTVTEPIQCYICGNMFRSRELQRMHLRLVHEIFVADAATIECNQKSTGSPMVAVNRFHCDYCSKYFKMKGSLRLHLRVVHGVFGVAAKATVNQKSSDSGELKTYDCLAHGLSENEHLNVIEDGNEQNIGVNDLLTKNSAINGNGSTIGLSPESGENTATDVKNWECDVCTKSFTTKYFLKKHKRLHTGKEKLI